MMLSCVTFLLVLNFHLCYYQVCQFSKISQARWYYRADAVLDSTHKDSSAENFGKQRTLNVMIGENWNIPVSTSITSVMRAFYFWMILEWKILQLLIEVRFLF